MTGPIPDHSAAGTGAPALLFLHGLGGSKDYWADHVERLAPRHRCVAWTMPGYGPSPALAETTFENLAAAAVRLLDATGIDRAVVVGHSMGAMVAQELWCRAPERIEALVLVASSPRFGGGSQRFVDDFLAARLAPLEEGRTPADIAPDTISMLTAAPLDPPALALATRCMADISTEAYTAALQCLTTFDRRAGLATISVPTLLVSGSEDRTAPSKVMASMAEAIPGSRHEDIPGAGHLVDLERPADFRAILDAFLAELRGSP